MHPIQSFPPASKQKLLFLEEFLTEHTSSFPAQRKGSVGAATSADPTAQGWLVRTCSSILSPHDALFFFLLAFLVILLGWECPMMSALFLGKRKIELLDFSLTFQMFQVRTWTLIKKEIFENSFNHSPCSQIDIQLPDSVHFKLWRLIHSFVYSTDIHWWFLVPGTTREERYAYRGLWKSAW